MKALSYDDYQRLSEGGLSVPLFRELPGDLRTPVSWAQRAIVGDPSAQLVRIPNNGHSVIGTDISGCALSLAKRFLIFGGTDGKCRQTAPPIPIAPRPASSLNGVKLLPGRCRGLRGSRCTRARKQIAGGYLALRDTFDQLLLGGSNFSIDEEESLILEFLSRRADGVYLTGTTHTDRARHVLKESRVPVVEIATLDGAPIAMLANLLTPPGAYSFKTTYDERLAKFSPGVLLQRENLDLLAREEIAWADSCAAADHPMIERIWREKRALVRVSIAVGGPIRRAAASAIFAAETRGKAQGL